jgi:glutathione S-transferase
MGYVLHITNKNYSSWSLRPWVLMRALGIAFDEVLHRFTPGAADDFRKLSPSGKVPWLVDGDTVVWDTLAIAEYLAERHPAVWPADAGARAWARSAAAEMHSGFTALRGQHGMNIGVRVAVAQRSPDASRHRAHRAPVERRPGALRRPLPGRPRLQRGRRFLRAGCLSLPHLWHRPAGRCAGYLATLLGHPAMREWEAAALAEDFRDPPHEAEMAQIGTVTADLRVPAR